MAYKTIEKFVESLEGHPVSIFTAPLTPLILQVPWSKDPAIPLNTLLINKGRESVFVVDEYFYHLCGETKFREYVEKKVTKQTLEEDFNNFIKHVQFVYDEVGRKNLSQAKESEILELLSKVIVVIKEFADTVYIETLNYDMALKVLGEKNKSLLDKIWDQATHPTFLSFEGRWLSYLLEQVKEKNDTSSIVRKVKYIYTDYHWTKSESEIMKELEELSSHIEENETKLKVIEDSFNVRKKEYEKWESTLSADEKYICDYIQIVMMFRDLRKDPIAKAQASLIEIALELLKRAGIEEKYGLALTMYECSKGVEHLKSIKGELIKRAEGNIMFIHMDSVVDIELCNYSKAVKEFHQLTSKESKDATESIKGQVANKGKATGRVRIILDPQNSSNFNEGDILVTSMTRPEFVPIMKKAAAVVTNEGGITCHAAIVSRELDIPCVIGTRVATRVLKEGDLVEVDAERGIVKILT